MDAIEKKQNELKKQLNELYSISFNWALSCCNYHTETAEEVLQESYIKALKSIDKFKGQSQLKTWLFTIIRNTSHDIHRKLARNNEITEDYLKDAKLVKTATQELRFQKSRDRVTILELMEKLSSREKEILELVVYQDMKIKDAAEIMGITLGSASSYLKRAKNNMRGLIEKPVIQQQDSANFEQTWTYSLELLSRKKAS